MLIAYDCIDGPKIGMIEDVESLSSELELQPLTNWKLSPNGHIHLPCSEESQRIARNIPETGAYIHEGTRIKGLASRASLPKLQFASRLKDRSAVCTIEINRLPRKAQPFVVQLVVNRIE